LIADFCPPAVAGLSAEADCVVLTALAFAGFSACWLAAAAGWPTQAIPPSVAATANPAILPRTCLIVSSTLIESTPLEMPQGIVR
jgi:hypothetical protein